MSLKAVWLAIPVWAAACDKLTIESPGDQAIFASASVVISVCVPAGINRVTATVSIPDPKDKSKTATVVTVGPRTLARGEDHWSPELALAGGLNIVTVMDADHAGSSASVHVQANAGGVTSDERRGFDATFYAGASVDSFASNDTKKYLGYTPADSGPLLGYIAGVDFDYRLFRRSGGGRWPWQVWVFGETMHGQRSGEVSCGASGTSPVCSGVTSVSAANQFLAVLRSSTSVEAFSGLRLEFFKLNPMQEHSANLYLKSQLGFLTVQNSGSDVVDDHTKLAIGTMMTNGAFRNSYLEAGWGKTDLFATHRGRRFKVDGYVEWTEKDTWPIRPFFELVLDSDFGPGADDIRAFYGVNVDIRNLGCLFKIAGCVTPK
jgi:hypothetical protein